MQARPEPQDGFDSYAQDAEFGWDEVYADEGYTPDFDDDYEGYDEYLDSIEDRFTPDYYGDVDSFTWEE